MLHVPAAGAAQQELAATSLHLNVLGFFLAGFAAYQQLYNP